MPDETPAADALQLSLIPFVARCGYCGVEQEVPTRELADRWAREHVAACERAPRSRARRRDEVV